MSTSTLSGAALRRRAEAIAQARRQIAEYGLTWEQIQAAECLPSTTGRAGGARYRNAEGQTWDGQGEMPAWLQRAVNAGQSIEHFRVSE
ncbi:H-NS histone family protein [Ralstonia chuxiongensis]|uniref:H-NS histone family protein n=1 Tax=Ralstonia chuxiongensis TaxID=2957504 RepID=UPI0028F6298D|nr:H-NS family nucleoid-associated regulatory protein [Ralstonia chuxiongensis]CAJ0783506.1 hypothetical protein R8510_05140 [Ralstonia chuxiongensis]